MWTGSSWVGTRSESHAGTLTLVPAALPWVRRCALSVLLMTDSTFCVTILNIQAVAGVPVLEFLFPRTRRGMASHGVDLRCLTTTDIFCR